jgi:hypothetical protein
VKKIRVAADRERFRTIPKFSIVPVLLVFLLPVVLATYPDSRLFKIEALQSNLQLLSTIQLLKCYVVFPWSFAPIPSIAQ